MRQLTGVTKTQRRIGRSAGWLVVGESEFTEIVVGSIVALAVSPVAGTAPHVVAHRFLPLSDVEQFLLFLVHGLVDLLDVVVGDLVEFLLGSFEFVGRDLPALLC